MTHSNAPKIPISIPIAVYMAWIIAAVSELGFFLGLDLRQYIMVNIKEAMGTNQSKSNKSIFLPR